MTTFSGSGYGFTNTVFRHSMSDGSLAWAGATDRAGMIERAAFHSLWRADQFERRGDEPMAKLCRAVAGLRMRTATSLRTRKTNRLYLNNGVIEL